MELTLLQVDQSSDHSRYYQIQAAFTGSESQVGPPVDPCKVVFGMRTVGKHGHHRKLDVSVCDTLPGCDIKFLDSQINGAAFMMQRSTGAIPVSPERASLPEVAAARERLISIQTFGGWLVDATGFGKTITCLLFVSQWALYSDHSKGHKPILIVVPNGAVFAQWCETLWEHFRDLLLIISNDVKPAESKYLNNWVSSTAMREAPLKVDNWPEHLRYVFDTEDPRASRTVFVTPWDTHKERTMDTDWVPTTKKSKETPKQEEQETTSGRGTCLRDSLERFLGFVDCGRSPSSPSYVNEDFCEHISVGNPGQLATNGNASNELTLCKEPPSYWYGPEC